MTVKEFSDAFDTIANSYSSKSLYTDAALGGNIVFDEYEKSLFLTKAQEQLVVELYSGRHNATSFEETEELRSNLRNLIKTETIQKAEAEYKGISEYSKFFKLPSDLLFITYESAIIEDESAGCKNGKELAVIPVSQDEFHRVVNNPFKGINNRRALRLDNGLDIVEIVSKYNLKNYTVRYLSKPTPIVLDNFDEVSIDNINTITECKLDSSMHQSIVERAVLLALATKNIQKSKD